MKTLKVKLSGTYKDNKGDIEEYENIKGIIPFCDEGRAHQVCKSRYARMWLSIQKKVRVKSMREVYMDSCVESEDTLTFLGKDIKEMTMEELQDLSVYLGLKIPAYKKSSLRNTRVSAVEKYLLEIKGVPAEKVARVIERGFDSLPKCIIKEQEEKKATEDEGVSLAEEMAEFGVDIVDEEESQEYTLEDLKNLAKAKGIKFQPNIGYDKLFKRVFEE